MPKTKPKYQDEEWLREQYLKRHKSMKEIAKECDVSPSTIYKWLRRGNIETRTPSEAHNNGEKYKNKQWLEEKYLEEKKTTKEIGKLCDVTFPTILRWLDKFNIDKRPKGWEGGKETLICKYCGEKFKVDPYEKERGAKFCSEECSSQWREENWTHPNKDRVKKTCQTCGQEYEVPRYKANRSKYCSRKCHIKAIAGDGRDNPNWQGGKVIRECKWCGKEFSVYPSRDKVTCSKECSKKYQGQMISGKNHPNWKEKIELTCKQCGKTYYRIPSHVEGSRFCSRECAGEWLSENRKGPEHPQWEGGSNEYMNKLRQNKGRWVSNRKEALRRDNHTCQFCGAKENGQQHDVHHIKPVRKGGSNFVGNLITLCRSCHIQLENKIEDK